MSVNKNSVNKNDEDYVVMEKRDIGWILNSFECWWDELNSDCKYTVELLAKKAGFKCYSDLRRIKYKVLKEITAEYRLLNEGKLKFVNKKKKAKNAK